MRNVLAVVMLMLSVALPARAQEHPPTLSLDQAIAAALAGNPSYRESLATVDAEMGRVRQARAPLGPSLALSDAYRYQDVVAKLSTPFGQLPFSPNTTNVPLLGVSYTLFDGGAGAARLAAASATLAGAKASVRAARASLVSTVSATYYDLAAALQAVGVVDRAVAVSQAHVTLARQRLAAGQIPRAELLEAQTDLADHQLTALTAHNVVAHDQNQLDAAMDIPLGTNHIPADGLDAVVPELDLTSLIAVARDRRGDLAAARLAVEASRRAVGVAGLQRAPTIDLVASEGNVQPVTVSGFRAQFTVGLNAVWKLFDNGYTGGRIDEARAAVTAATLEVRRLQTNVELEVRQAYLDVQTARLQVKAAKRLVTLADENQRLAEVRYRGGVGTSLELRDAESRDDSARQTLVDSQRSLVKSFVAVRFAAGFL